MRSSENLILDAVRSDRCFQPNRTLRVARWWTDAIQQFRQGVPFTPSTDAVLRSSSYEDVEDAERILKRLMAVFG